MAAAERTIACGLCSTPITESVFRAGGGKAIRGTVYCSSCAELYEKALADTLAWRGSLGPGQTFACARCQAAIPIDDIRDEQVLFARGKLACKKCSKDLRALLLAPARTTSSRAVAAQPFAFVKAPEEKGGAAGVVLALLGTLLLGGALAFAFVRGRARPSDAAPPPVADKASQDLERALALVSAAPPSFEKAKAVLAEVTALAAAHKGSVELEARFARAVQRATVARDGFAPLLASDALEQAAAEIKKSEDPDPALAALAKFPAELLGTASGAEVALAKERYEALGTCRRRALYLLSFPSPANYVEMDQLLATPEAEKSGFAQTEVGKRVESERRLRRNAAAAGDHGGYDKAPPYDAALAGWYEWKFDLVEAESRYKAALDQDRDCPEANIGLARIYLERDRLDVARPYAERAFQLARHRTDVNVLQAWFAHLAGGREAWAEAVALMLHVPDKWLGRLGRRMRWILSLKEPIAVTARTRVYARGASLDDLGDIPTGAEATAETAASIFAIPKGAEHVDVFFFPDDAARATFLKNLELRKVTDEGVLPGCFAVAPPSRDLALTRLAVAAALARRAPGACPEWLLVSLPRILASRNVVTSPKIKLQDLERLDAERIRASADALQTADAYASLACYEDGEKALAFYVSARIEGATIKAREELEKEYGRLVQR